MKASLRASPPPAGTSTSGTMVFNRFKDGILVENWGLHDHATALAQIRAES